MIGRYIGRLLYTLHTASLCCTSHATVQVYRRYVGTFTERTKTAAALQESSKKFKAFVEEAHATEEMKDTNLASLMVMPVQRIPRYLLLLQEMYKRTADDHPDKKPLRRAVVFIKRVADDVNNEITRHEVQMQMWQVQNSITPPQPLIAPGRKLVKEGLLNKVCREGDVWIQLVGGKDWPRN